MKLTIGEKWQRLTNTLAVERACTTEKNMQIGRLRGGDKQHDCPCHETVFQASLSPDYGLGHDRRAYDLAGDTPHSSYYSSMPKTSQRLSFPHPRLAPARLLPNRFPCQRRYVWWYVR